MDAFQFLLEILFAIVSSMLHRLADKNVNVSINKGRDLLRL